MTTTRKYNKSEIMTITWRRFRTNLGGVYYYSKKSFGELLKEEWAAEKARVIKEEKEVVETYEISEIEKIAQQTGGSTCGLNRIYFNGANGSVYAEKNNDTWIMGIKRSDLNAFTVFSLNSLLDDKAQQLQNLGLTLR